MDSKEIPDDKLNFKAIAPIFFIVLVDLLGLTIIIPLLPIYAAAFGADAFLIGLLGATYPFFQFIAAPFLGQLSDRHGRRPVLLASQIGTLLGFILLALANSLALVFVSRMIDGISGANIVTAQAVLTDKTSEKTRTQALGLIGAAFGLGFIIGPFLAFAILAITNNNYSMVALAAAGFSILSILMTWFWLEESLPEEKRGQAPTRGSGFTNMATALRRPEISLLLILIFLQQFLFNGFEQFLPVFTLERLGMDASQNAVLFIYAGILIIIVQGGLIGRLSRKLGDRPLALMGMLVLGVSLIMIAFTPTQPLPGYSRDALIEHLSIENASSVSADTKANEPELQLNIPEDGTDGILGIGWMLIALIPFVLGGGVLQPTINSLITQQISLLEIGNILGVSAAFISLANVFAPLYYGITFETVGSTIALLSSGLLLLALWLFARPRLPLGKKAAA